MFYAINSKLNKILINQEIFLASKRKSSNKFFSKIKKIKTVFLVTGKKSYENSGSKRLIEDALKNSKIVIFNDFNVNPDISEIKVGFKIAKKINPDAIIAVGGGSVIDAAKIIHAMLSNNLDEESVFNVDQIEMYKSKNVIPLIAIPTTAGTGSEATHFAVLYKARKKYSIASSKMLPSIVYLNSELCESNTSYQNACSGFDALSQAIESYWSKNSNYVSRYYALKSLKITLNNIEGAVYGPKKNNNYLFNMLVASNYAGKAINITKTTGPHAISYGITKDFGLPHGHAVALTLGAFFELHNKIYSQNTVDLKFYKIVDNYISKNMGKSTSSFLYDLMKKFDMEYDLSKLGLSMNDADTLIKNINLERMSNHPVSLSTKQLKEIFNLIPDKN